MEPESPKNLKPLSENWSKAIAIVAHPDDMEFGAAAAVARWTGHGKHVSYVMVTSGEAGIDGIEPEESRRVREAEQVESCRIVGVDTVEFLGLPDGIVEYGVPLRRTLAQVIRRHQPEIILTGNFRDTFGPGALNQADHIAVGRAGLDAARDAGNRWIFNDQLVDGLEPWGGVRAVWAFGSPEARHGVDTTETFDAGVAFATSAEVYSLTWGGDADD
jgi:LmbE family N-acetylglucosaminyl deacetylase